DPESVASCRELKRRSGDPENWDVLEASVLDAALPSIVPQGDFVYSWGVLHHTGDMYSALRIASDVVKPGGLFCIAIYNRGVGQFVDSERWQGIKLRYNHSPRAVQALMEWTFFAYWAARQVYARKNPIRVAREYKKSRGMALATDLVDWLGGYPYEFATADEIVGFCRAECGMEIVRVLAIDPRGIGNNQFVFRRTS